jgi:hypothetical protein
MANVHPIEYRDVPGFPGYRVGDDGSVWFAWRTCRAGRRLTDRWKPMKIATHWKGYLCINLTPAEGGKYRTFRVHRLVLEAFVGPCPDGMECRHLNGIKGDCRLENLCWGTPDENRDDIRRHGTYRKGETHHWVKLTADDVRAIRARHAAGGVLQRQLADEFGVNVANINAIVNRRSWKHLD